MAEAITFGLDTAKHVFQVHGVDGSGAVTVRRKVRRSELLKFFDQQPRCLVGLEACAAAHHWARQLQTRGFQVRLMPPGYVKPYVKRQKNDQADAEAICEAVRRPTMRFVPVKNVDQQALLMLHRSRDVLVRQRTMLINALRGHLAEFGIVTRQGGAGVGELIAAVERNEHEVLVPMARATLLLLIGQLKDTHARIGELDRRINTWHRSNEVSKRLETIPGIGPITASALSATITDPSLFKSGRQLAAWIGLVPRQTSSGGKDRLGRISKQGDRYLRRLLVVGAHSVLRSVANGKMKSLPWAAQLLARRPYKLAAIALANKMARIVWAMLMRNETYRPQVCV